MKIPQIAIVILHYKNLADTRECLQSLQKVDYPSYYVIVVNNDSPDHARELQNEFDDFIQIVQNSENLGFAEGNNVGLRHALADPRTEAVLILNNDTVVESNFLTELVRTLTLPSPWKGEGTIGMIAPCMIRHDQRDKIDNLGLVLMSSGLPFNRCDEKQKLFCPSGGAVLYTKKILEATTISPPPSAKRQRGEVEGGAESPQTLTLPSPLKGEGTYWFDPLFFAYCEDLDLGWRTRNLGFTAAHAPTAIVYHKGSASTAKLSDFAVYHTYRNLLWTQCKNLPGWLLLWQLPWLGAGWLFLLAFYTLKGRPGVIFRALLDGILGLRFIYQRHRQIQKRRAVNYKTILSWFTPGLFPKNLFK